MVKRVRPQHILRLLVCLAIAAAMQIPIAWAWAYLFVPVGYFENTACINAPNSASDPPDVLRIGNSHYEGVRWITVTRWIAGSAPDWRTRSNAGEPYDSNPVYPLSINQVFAGITDAAAWPQLPPGATPPGNITFVQVEIQGIPFACVYGRMMGPPGSNGMVMEGMHWFAGHTWRNFSRQGEDLILPFHPIWSGYILNTLAWGLPLFALTLVPPAIRRTLRRRRGLCPACAYDLRATPAGSPCPECGSALTGSR
ncbi:MAG: hypothetical protein KF699_07280 [Phycisphaeraceae bacterium]|nr:hypothetical protein [Phycisphaeraceae bacterium]